MEPENTIVPDVIVFPNPALRAPASGGTAVLEPATGTERSARIRSTNEPLLISLTSEEARESYIDIIAVREGGRIVTTIELLSSSNKRSGSGAEEYRRKQRQVLASSAHLLEIDLLRGGKHSVAAPKSHILPQQPFYDYLICLHQARAGNLYHVWAFGLRDALPTIPVPLTEKYEDVPLDLQTAFAQVIRGGAYDRSIDYSIALDPTLTATDAAWADALLRERGLR